ncbi:putative Dynamin-like kDa protein, mitochondrial [Glarea lozoyensis 74030]|uniref:Putative Dynamin-like kDa protein, mitochondrial n=1 Tax=Glarea lozoyensis (strain ATCC 74030 / MF5533) TaxID=1104152 RepID=H0EUY3_GLAL7|nr:putative Dynamin-like kDa protein, mitochondrial [Glarea lozoyensis 74030]
MPPNRVKGDFTVTSFGYPTPKERTMSNEPPDNKIEEWNLKKSQGILEDAHGHLPVGCRRSPAQDTHHDLPHRDASPTEAREVDGHPGGLHLVGKDVKTALDAIDKIRGLVGGIVTEIPQVVLTIREESELEDVLKWAQIALLNPSISPQEFVPDSNLENVAFLQHKQLRENNAVKEQAVYSPNVIAISISAPGLPALSFFDLPGLIVSAASDQYLPEAFRTMTREYVRHEKSLIIYPQNSTARLLIRQERAEHRCVGVLTNSDRVTDTTDGMFSIPEIHSTVLEELEKVEHELSSLPKVNDKAQVTVRTRLNSLENGLRGLLDNSSNVFHSQWKELCNQFSKALDAMRPMCDCAHPSDKQVKPTIYELDSDSCGEGASPVKTSPVKLVKRSGEDLGNIISPKKTKLAPKEETSPTLSLPIYRRPGVDVDEWRKANTRSKGDLGPFWEPYTDWGKGMMTLSTLKTEISKQIPAGVPDGSLDKIKREYALQSVARWDAPLQTFLAATFDILSATFQQQLDTDIKREYNETEFYKRSQAIIASFLKRSKETLHDQTMRLFKVEKSALFTMNNASFENHKKRALEWFKGRRRMARIEAYCQVYPTPAYTKALTFSQGDPRREEFMAEVYSKFKMDKLGEDKFQSEIALASYIRAYYMTARQRFCDSVCAAVNAHLIDDMFKALEYYVQAELKIDEGGEVRCQELLAGNAKVVKRRMELEDNRKRLQESLDWIRKLRQDSSADVLDTTMKDGE